MEKIEQNGLSQAYALKAFYLPTAEENEANLAKALWLHKTFFESLANAVASGIAKAFKG
ncbi:DUF6890 family protein [Seminibacterium arietis]|uniref:DUF6890 family protein n=1 Tax=Seminibacterium arietis TaxID=1173502 RepID=A0ABW3I855_9PAST